MKNLRGLTGGVTRSLRGLIATLLCVFAVTANGKYYEASLCQDLKGGGAVLQCFRM